MLPAPRPLAVVAATASTVLILSMSACAGENPALEADLIVRGGRIVTVNQEAPEVEALASRNGRILAMGSAQQIAAYEAPGTRIIELQEGQLAVPGFIEGHGHFMGVGDARLQLDLMDAESWDAVVAMVEEAVADTEPGVLIRGRGWHQEKWSPRPDPNVEGLPLHDKLSAVSPDNPVILRHASGHATFANGRAMEMAGIDASTPDPEGGEIVRDADGAPIGAFRETASRLLRPAMENADPPDRRQQARLAAREVLSKGVTTFHDAGTSYETVELYRELVDDDALGVRLWVMLDEDNDALAERMDEVRTVGYGRGRLTVRAIKRVMDGALGSHGAWLLEPYADLPSSTGLNTTPVEVIEETARLAVEHGYQLATHAIGDRANRETLDLYEEAFRAAGADGDTLRWRVEHAQHLHPDDIPRFAELGVIASMQGIHCTSDAPWVIPRLGEARAGQGAYVWKSLLDTGAVVTNGTDAPVEDVDPIASYYATVSRMTDAGERFFPDQRLSRMEALRSYTIHNAYAAFEEEHKGSIGLGKLADVTILSRDILEIPEAEIPDARVLYTIVGGEVMYEGDGRETAAGGR